jgi:predicted nucleic acid-binding protein
MHISDANSVSAAAILARTRGALITSAMGEAEVLNALELGVFRNRITRLEGNRARSAFQEDVIDLDPATWSLTKQLIVQHSSRLGCRTADIAHVATALQANVDQFFTFDIRQTELARRVKLKTK